MAEASTAAGPPERYFSIFGFIIVRKADFLAATAFLLALSSASYQLFGILWGSHIHVYAPDHVTIFFDYYGDNRIVARAAGQLTFTNSGQAGRSDTVREAFVDIGTGGKSYREHWLNFVHVTRNGHQLQVDPKDEAYPLAVSGGGTVSRMASFAPRIRMCKNDKCDQYADYVDDVSFLTLLTRNLGKPLTLSFGATTFGGDSVEESTCSVMIDKHLLTYLAANDWFEANCQSGDED